MVAKHSELASDDGAYTFPPGSAGSDIDFSQALVPWTSEITPLVLLVGASTLVDLDDPGASTALFQLLQALLPLVAALTS